MTDTADLADLTDAILAAARAAGADAADALAVDGTSVSIGVRARALEEAERAEAAEIGLRVLVGRRQACVSASDTRRETLQSVAERAVAMARAAPEDPTLGLADPDQLAASWDLAALDLVDAGPEPDPEALQAAAHAMEDAALAVPGISQVDGASAGYSRTRIHLSATNGFSGGYVRTGHGRGCTAITGDGTGMERDAFADQRLHRADLIAPEEIGRRAAERAMERANPKRPKTGHYPVLFDERVASSLIGHLLSAINGTAIARGASWARGLMGERVLPEGLSVTEDPTRARGPASRPFDAEGLPVGPRALVDDGVLQSWVLDLGTARKLGLASTANAARGTSGPPSPTVSNIALTDGPRSRDDLIAEMGTGLIVTSMIGATINPNTGEYSRGASGIWVENGEPRHAVNEITIAGNLIEMLRNLRPANDARPHLSRVVPSCLVEGLTLAGS